MARKPKRRVRRVKRPSLPALNSQERYEIPEAAAYLRVSRAHVYRLINADPPLKTIHEGKRVFVPGSEIVRLSTLPVEAQAMT